MRKESNSDVGSRPAHSDAHIRIPHHVLWGTYLEQKGWLTRLDLATSFLSLFTVVSYIISTYNTADFSKSDFAIGLIFAAEWSFRVYLSQSRFMYVLSWTSFVDVITFMPMVILTIGFETRPLATVCFRLLRIMRIFRILSIARLGQKSQSEVKKKMIQLCVTLLCIMLMAASTFYEIEHQWGDYAEDRSDLQFHDCLYWAAVTISTVGYGDISPTVWGSQILFIAMMLLFLTVLPYQTSQLMEALTHSSRYQRERYWRKPQQAHVVITGGFDHSSLSVFLKELFHEDHGFRQTNAVVLGPELPDGRVREILNSEEVINRCKYVQGSPSVAYDLWRCQTRYADAVFILCDKYSSDPLAEDTRNIMTLLSIGQALQQYYGSGIVDVKKGKGVRKCWHSVVGVEKTGPPKIYIQLLLPQSVQRLAEVLTALQQKPKLPPSSSKQQQESSPPHTSTRSRLQVGSSDSHIIEGLPHLQKSGTKPLLSIPLATKSVKFSEQDMDASEFWKRFELSVSSLCLSELKEALVGLSCLGSRGLMPLLANLCRSFDTELTELQHYEEQLPDWLREYVGGLGSEIYELRRFPPHLHQRPFGEVAQYLYDSSQLLLLGLGYKHAGGRWRLMLVPFNQAVTADMSGYLIASDISDVAQLEWGCQEDYTAWLAATSEAQRFTSKAMQQSPPTSPRQHAPSTTSSSIHWPHMAGIKGLLTAQPSAAKPKLAKGKIRYRHDDGNSFLAQDLQSFTTAVSAIREQQLALGSPRLHHQLSQFRQSSRRIKARSQVQISHLVAHYHLREGHEQARGYMMEIEEGDFAGHVLVLNGGSSPDCLVPAIAPFRSKLLERWVPIVIMDEMSPVGPGWDELARFPDVHFISGSPLSGRDLARASATTAAKAMIFPTFGAPKDSGREGGAPQDDDITGDADVIFIAQKLRTVNPGIQIYTELLNPANLAFLNPLMPFRGLGEVSAYLMPPYTAGNVYMGSFADTLTCQTFYNRTGGKIVNQLLVAWNSDGSSTAFTSGGSSGSRGDGTTSRTVLVNIQAVSDSQYCLTFGELFTHLLVKRNMLCVALYRQASSEGRSFGYVVTRPSRDLALRAGDEAMVVMDLSLTDDGCLPDDVCGYTKLADGLSDGEEEQQQQQQESSATAAAADFISVLQGATKQQQSTSPELPEPQQQQQQQRRSEPELPESSSGKQRHSWVRAASRSSSLLHPPPVRQLSAGGSQADALQEVYASVQQLQVLLQEQLQDVHREVRSLKDRLNSVAGGTRRATQQY